MLELVRDRPERLNVVIRGDDGPDAVLLLGAGASVKSGVPLAGDLVSMAAIWGYCQENGRYFDDPTLMRSDWQPWLERQGWFDPGAPMADQYPKAVERLLQPRESRRRFFLRVLGRAQIAPSPGYAALAQLVAANAVRHVLTVNFDDLAQRACRADPSVSHVDVIASRSDLVKFSLAPTYPQIVHLHGAVERYEDRNLEDETQTLDAQMREAVMPLLRDHPLVVVGYRGAEPSIMNDLLLRGADQVHAYRHGVFWCVLRGEEPGAAVLRLAERLGTNFRLVEIPGFDEAMSGWAGSARPARAPHVRAGAPEPDVPDLRPERDLVFADLDRPTLSSRLGTYAERMGLRRLDAADDDTLIGRLEEMRLARREDGAPVLTRGARLLFAGDDRTRVEIHAGEVFLPIAGNIFRVLDRALEALEELNEPYRLKGPTSEDVRRFDRRALKELVVNALAHRDHDRDEPVRIRMSARELTVVSPGGLVSGLRPELLGEPGQRAYRNPVIADVLFGCGAMDKRGSGLADVKRWTRQSGGEATFAPSEDERNFVASLVSRDLDPDPVTGTADPGEIEHFVSNALPIVLQGEVYVAPSPVSSRQDVYDAHPNHVVPAFAVNRGSLLTFARPDAPGGILSGHISGASVARPIDEFKARPDTERLLVQLLNSVVLSWARQRDLYSDAASRRLWFPRSDEGARVVTYRGRVKESTRTVTKPNISRSTGEVRYWEHEAIRFSFRRFDDDWVVHIVPTIVFTSDGYGTLLRGPKVGPLATRRMARDYNPQVQNDLFFWRWVLVGEHDEASLDDAVTIRSNFLARDVVDAPAATGGLRAEDDQEPEDDVADEVAEVAASQGVEEDGTGPPRADDRQPGGR